MKQLSDLPQFEKISLKRQPRTRSLAANYPSYSEFNFTNLFAWDIHNMTQVSYFDKGCAILLQHPATKNQFYTLIGSRNLDGRVKQLLEISRQQGFDTCLRRVPQTVVDGINHSDFTIQEDRDNFDYILSASYHAGLRGPKNGDRRYLIRKFLKENGARLTVSRLDLTDHRTQSDILCCMSQWILTRHRNTFTSELERLAITRVLDASDQLPVQALGFYLDGIMHAFSIFEGLNKTMGIVHFEKYNLAYKGIAPYVRHSVAKEFSDNHIASINYEQDLGISGLRQAKLLLHPKRFLKKYTISVKS